MTALLLLTALLFSGCTLSWPLAGQDPAETPEPTPSPAPDPEQLAKEQRLEEAQDGFIWEDGYLLTIDETGVIRTDCYVGVLSFGGDGRYTSGDTELDELVAEVVRNNTDVSMSRLEKLHAMYNYTRDHIRYVGFPNHDLSYQQAHGPDGWMIELAVKALQEGIGNCYYFAAAFTALARGVGYQAYATGGLIGAIDDPHGWVQIVDEDGSIRVCDPEMEYRLADWKERTDGKQEIPDLFWRTKEEVEGLLGMGYRQLKDPFEPEAKEGHSAEAAAAAAEADPGEAESAAEDVSISLPDRNADSADPAEPESPEEGEGASSENGAAASPESDR